MCDMVWCLHGGNQTQILIITYSQDLLPYSGYIHIYVYNLTHNTHIGLSSQSHGCAKPTPWLSPCSFYVLNAHQPKLIGVVCKGSLDAALPLASFEFCFILILWKAD